MKDARREKSKLVAEEAIKRYSDDTVKMQVFLEGALFQREADSHPDTADSGDEGPYRYSHPKLKAAFDEGYAHARKSQAHETLKCARCTEEWLNDCPACGNPLKSQAAEIAKMIEEAVKAERERIITLLDDSTEANGQTWALAAPLFRELILTPPALKQTPEVKSE